jgi:uncharacterized protein YdhG (YjbR/CyaY superfamily)
MNKNIKTRELIHFFKWILQQFQNQLNFLVKRLIKKE